MKLEAVTLSTRGFFQSWNKHVKSGRVIVVTEWGKPKAILIPIELIKDMPESCKESLEELVFRAIMSTKKE